MTAYLDFYNEKPEKATDIAAKWRKVKLPKAKRKLFEDIEAQTSELSDYQREDEEKDAEMGMGDRDREVDQRADTEPSVEFEVKDRKVALSYHNVKECTINFYVCFWCD